MGRIRTTPIKRITHELIEKYGYRFTDNFEENQRILAGLIITPSKRLRNKIAGYVTTVVKKGKKSEESEL